MLFKQVVSISALASTAIAAPALVQRFNGERALDMVGKRDLAGLEKSYALMRRRPLRKRSELRSFKRQLRDPDNSDSSDDESDNDDRSGNGRAQIQPTGAPRSLAPTGPFGAVPTAPAADDNARPLDPSGPRENRIQPTGPAVDLPPNRSSATSSAAPTPTLPPANVGNPQAPPLNVGDPPPSPPADAGDNPSRNDGSNPENYESGADNSGSDSEAAPVNDGSRVVRPPLNINVGAIVGGALAVLAAIILAVWLFMRSKRRRKQETQAIPFILESPIGAPPMAAFGSSRSSLVGLGFDTNHAPADWEQFPQSSSQYNSPSGITSPQQAYAPGNVNRA